MNLSGLSTWTFDRFTDDSGAQSPPAAPKTTPISASTIVNNHNQTAKTLKSGTYIIQNVSSKRFVTLKRDTNQSSIVCSGYVGSDYIKVRRSRSNGSTRHFKFKG